MAHVTVASQGRDAAPLNWLRKPNLAPLPGHGNSQLTGEAR